MLESVSMYIWIYYLYQNIIIIFFYKFSYRCKTEVQQYELQSITLHVLQLVNAFCTLVYDYSYFKTKLLFEQLHLLERGNNSFLFN